MPLLRSAFIALSRNSWLRRFSEQSSIGQKVSLRFVAGTQVKDVLRAAKELNRLGIRTTLDSLGENVSTPEQVRASAAVYHDLLDAIAEHSLDANVSVKLTQMGLEMDEELTFGVVSELVAHAAAVNNFVRIDMEGSELTTTTLDMVHQWHAQKGAAGHVGVVIQAYLYRSEKDIQSLLQNGIRIRLCKGAYKEPESVAFPQKADVDANYRKLARILLKSGVFHGLATHDVSILEDIKKFVRDEGIDPKSFEFQMLYGVRRDLQRKLVEEGFGVRVYVPFGTEWYPYFMRRLAERPANVLFLAKNFFRK